jgi:hypothetical protein
MTDDRKRFARQYKELAGRFGQAAEGLGHNKAAQKQANRMAETASNAADELIRNQQEEQ